MASEIKVDTIVNAGGDNDTGIDLATNDQILLKVANATKLTMNSTGQTTIVGEGGTTTTSVQQGLVKCFVRTDEPGTALTSFNVSSNSDVATGQHKSSYTNNMSASKNSCTASGCEGAVNTNTILFEITSNESSSQVEGLTLLLNGTSSHSISDADISISVHGDLA
jgi:hypothetical protein